MWRYINNYIWLNCWRDQLFSKVKILKKLHIGRISLVSERIIYYKNFGRIFWHPENGSIFWTFHMVNMIEHLFIERKGKPNLQKEILKLNLRFRSVRICQVWLSEIVDVAMVSGSVFALSSLFGVTSVLIGSVLFNAVYSATIGWYRGFTFIFGAILSTIPIFISV